jgi:hypothetical protein
LSHLNIEPTHLSPDNRKLYEELAARLEEN